MDKVRKNYCGLLDGRISEIIDSANEEDRFEAMYKLMLLDISSALLSCKREYPNSASMVLVLGLEEIRLFKEYQKKLTIRDQEDLDDFIHDHPGAPVPEVSKTILNEKEYFDTGVLKFWDMPIYRSSKQTFIAVFPNLLLDDVHEDDFIVEQGSYHVRKKILIEEARREIFSTRFWDSFQYIIRRKLNVQKYKF